MHIIWRFPEVENKPMRDLLMRIIRIVGGKLKFYSYEEKKHLGQSPISVGRKFQIPEGMNLYLIYCNPIRFF